MGQRSLEQELSDFQTLVRPNFQGPVYWEQSIEPPLPATFTETVQTTSVMVVPTQSDTLSLLYSMTYIALSHPDFYLLAMRNTRLSQTMYRKAEHLTLYGNSGGLSYT